MANEIELKLKVIEKGDITKKLQDIFPGISLEPKELINIYFDTRDFKLNQERIALRIRNKGGQYIQTLKTKGVSVNGLHQRGEWEWPLANNQLSEEELNACEAWPVNIEVNALEPVFETNFTRYQATFYWKRAEVELALDQGKVLSNGQSEVINEIEIELISGKADALTEMGKLIQSHLSVEQSDISKAERGYRLY